MLMVARGMARVPNEKGSPHADKDIVIANGAIRSGKTIACICSFMRWS